ncbi:hypothetical protein AK812_SmicGene45175 [Symbiodinium microadriaticum]|uniref:CCHC-type domain-containing protein n=1 Tax=Symbiodinium microadriaticum TaxID=2951 RepID=A0A1Q9BWN2_SYMMI|nr:hypothetical protein AK812_SmicGene45175 [Symbiodinium microadriaticum]
MSSSTGGQGSRTKDGVPIWDGEAGTFNDFEEACLMYEQSIAKEKRYLCGPKILAELTGAARRLVAGKGATWISYSGGVNELLRHLRACLGKPQISELSEFLNKYFKHSRRRPQETINDYVTRKCEVYLRAQQALRRVAPHHTMARTGVPSRSTTGSGAPWWPGSRRSSVDSTEHSVSEARPEVQSAAPTAATTEGTEEDDQDREERYTWNQGGNYSGTGTWERYPSWHSWGYGGYDSWWGTNHNWWTSPSTEDAQDAQMPELLPDYVQGWYLLQDAGLTTQERNVVQTALQGDFSLQRVAQELRNQWSGSDLLKRESGHRQSGYFGDYQGDDPELEDEEDFNNQEVYDQLDVDGQAEWNAQEEEVQGALAAMHQAKRTLREARARQHDVKLSRQYYKTNPKGGGKGRGQGTGAKDDSAMTCLRCGKVGHRVANCPHPPTASAQATTTPEATSSFICFNNCEADPVVEAYALGVTTTTEAVSQGKAVVDGGATRTLASIDNQAKHGTTGIAMLDMTERPVFGFGDSSENQCASTAHLQIKAQDQTGKLKVHCLDHGNGPLLLSVETLRNLGHQLLDMTEELLLLAAVAMYRKTRAELVAELLKYHEHPAPGWTKVEIRQRLLELQGRDEEQSKKSLTATTLQEMTREMRKANKTKASLVAHCETELGMQLTGNETKPQLEMKAMNKIMSIAPAEAMDLVGFGKHVERRYHEILDEFWSYGEWVVQTARENPNTSDPRLRRLAGWLEPRMQAPASSAQRGTSSRMEERATWKPTPKTQAKAFLKPKMDPSESTTSSPEVVADQTKKMEEMAAMIHKLQDELESMKGERPRKQKGYASEDTMTDRSFVEVTAQPP